MGPLIQDSVFFQIATADGIEAEYVDKIVLKSVLLARDEVISVIGRSVLREIALASCELDNRLRRSFWH